MADSLSSDLASLRINRDEPPQGGAGRTILIILACCSLLGGAAVWAYPRVEASLFRATVQLTEVSLVSPAQATVELTATGYVIAQQSSKVAAKAQGRLAKVLVNEGDRVEAGQLLALLEDGPERSALSTARARMGAARARTQTAKANLAEGELRASRERVLAQRGAAAMASAQDQEARVKALQEGVRAAEAEAAAAAAEVAAMGVNLDLNRITAPIAGTIVTRPLRPGELVGPGTSPILEMADFTTLVVEVDVPEGRLSKLKTGSPAEIILDAYPQRRYRGSVTEIVPRVNRAKATVPVKVRFTDPPTDVLPEMAARVSVLKAALSDQAIKEPPKLVLPEVAVAERGGQKVVFVVEEEGVKQVAVDLGPPFGGGFEIKGPSTLTAGTKVVSSPPLTMADGHKIKEKND